MRRRTHRSPELESLESLSLLSGAAAAIAHHPHPAIVSGVPVQLSGTEHGVFSARRNASGTDNTLFAAGRLAPVGLESTSGTLHVVSGLSSGPPNGTWHIFTTRGTLTLQVPKSVLLPAGLPAPTSSRQIVDTYVITRGTGAYRGDTGSGVVEITLHSANSITSRYQAGTVELTFTTTTGS